MTKENSSKFTFPQPGSEYQVPPEGSLGLLALGARGIELWRKARAEAQERLKNEQPSPDNEKK